MVTEVITTSVRPSRFVAPTPPPPPPSVSFTHEVPLYLRTWPFVGEVITTSVRPSRSVAPDPPEPEPPPIPFPVTQSAIDATVCGTRTDMKSSGCKPKLKDIVEPSAATS